MAAVAVFCAGLSAASLAKEEADAVWKSLCRNPRRLRAMFTLTNSTLRLSESFRLVSRCGVPFSSTDDASRILDQTRLTVIDRIRLDKQPKITLHQNTLPVADKKIVKIRLY